MARGLQSEQRVPKGVDELSQNVVAQGNVAMMNKARQPVPTKLAKVADSALFVFFA